MTDQAPDLFPETLPREVEITDPEHIFRVGTTAGLASAVDILRDVPESKRQPGFAYALALIEAETASHRADMVAANMRALAKAGVDLVATEKVHIRGFTLIATPMPQGEEVDDG